MNPSRLQLLSSAFALIATPLPAAAGAPPARTAASARLDGLRDQYQTRLPAGRHIALLDPDRLADLPQDTRLSASLQTTLADQGLDLPPSLAVSLAFSLMTSSDTGPYAYNMLGDESLNHVVALPYTLPAVTRPGSDDVFCIVTAEDNDFILFQVPGLDARQMITFFNRHEFWHCLNDVGKPPAADGAALAGGGLPVADYQRTVDILQDEATADLGAIADMIAYDGADTSIIPLIACWRRDNLKSDDGIDINHYSGVALADFKARIDGIGLAAFRGLTDAARAELVQATARQSLPDARIMRDLLRAVIRDKKAPPPRPPKGLAGRYYAEWLQAQAPAPRRQLELSEAQLAQLAKWDAAALLRARAGGTAPGPLAGARRGLLEELRAAIAARPDDVTNGAKIVLLNKAYQQLLAAPKPAAAGPKM